MPAKLFQGNVLQKSLLTRTTNVVYKGKPQQNVRKRQVSGGGFARLKPYFR